MEAAIEIVQANPLFVASALASLVGLTAYYLFSGFIHVNYQKIMWFRRLFLPHITLLLRNVDENNKRVDLSRLYVETEAQPEEEVFDLRLSEDDTREEAVDKIAGYLISEKFRPEVILSSLAKHPDGYPEVGNFVLTAPEKSHTTLAGYGVFKEIFRMFTSKYQLHLRLYYDKDKHRILFHAHYEMNPYNPIYAKKHFNSVEFNIEKGVELFRNYQSSIRQFGVELIEE